MPGPVKPCPHCGASLPEGASFCPYCAKDLHPRQAVFVPIRRWLRPLRRAGLLLAAAALIAALILLYDAVTPDVYDAYGELIYEMDGSDYHLAVSFRNDGTPEPEYTVQVESDESYQRSSKLIITHVDTGIDAGRMFNQQIDSCQVRVLQPDNASPVICHAPLFSDDNAGSLLVSTLDFTGTSQGPVEVEWRIDMKNGDTILLRQTLAFEPVDTIHYYPEDYDMDTIEDLQALVDQIQEEVPLPTVVRLHLPPVHYEGGLTIDKRSIQLSGSVDEKNMRTAFLGPVVIRPEQDPLTIIENIDFRGSGSDTGLTIEADCRVRNCLFTGWDTGMLVGGEDWADPVGCSFEDNDVGLCFHSAGSYVNCTDFEGNTFLRNQMAVNLLQVPGTQTIYFSGCRFSGNNANINNPTGHVIDTTYATFE
ncbi:zinc ribbon domain-containing protein [Pseudoflavonifractor sp. DSM 107456]|uniref:Zinc ribbon domain-containing protein n=1 Tax=Pseudoflavonifractor gallinarum TaxID=2779352 RepID=A0ABR9RE14_9FIRM|nr:zinc ribbon domain-containing protein [Pseudoflavonifractor gallinarum]MBE5056906.1 zinc ribbon domain-containing protein [Pseudoflavonifractor gallinarum]